MPNLNELKTKTTDWLDFHKKEVSLFLIIFFVATISFGLGYLANREFNHAPIIIEKAAIEE